MPFRSSLTPSRSLTQHARLWALLESSGTMIGGYDLIVAATALDRGSAVATYNHRHFFACPGTQNSAARKGLTLMSDRDPRRHPRPPRLHAPAPARSSAEIKGEPMIAWVYRAARACPLLDRVLIATDSDEVLQLRPAALPLPAVFTPEDCASGTDRVWAVAQSHSRRHLRQHPGRRAPPHPPSLRTRCCSSSERPEVQVATIAVRCPPPRSINNPSAVKVVTAADGRALYFSRATIPFDRDNSGISRLSQAPRRLRLSQIRDHTALLDRAGGTSRATPPARQRHRHPRRPCSQRHHRSRHRRRPPAPSRRKRFSPRVSQVNAVDKTPVSLR